MRFSHILKAGVLKNVHRTRDNGDFPFSAFRSRNKYHVLLCIFYIMTTCVLYSFCIHELLLFEHNITLYIAVKKQ